MNFDFASFETVVSYLKERLVLHHQLYSSQCKAEYFEENLCNVLKQSKFGSDWKPDFNHKSGVDQTTDAGIKISNKSGTIKGDEIEISGSRLTKFKNLEDKLEFLSCKKEDYIFCLATDKNEWNNGIKKYYFIIIDSNKLNYHEQQWTESYGIRGRYKDKVNGWKCTSEVFSAKINQSMSDQLWTCIKLSHCEKIYEIDIG